MLNFGSIFCTIKMQINQRSKKMKKDKKQVISGILVKTSKLFAAKSVTKTCPLYAYQPKVPKSLKKN